MNIKKTFIAGISLCLLILAGCQNSASNQANQPVNSVQSSSQQGSQISAADTAAFNGAVQLKDLSFCDKLSTADLKALCKNTINDAKIAADALIKTDASLCSQISNSDKAAACKIQVEVALKEKENAQNFQTDMQKEQQLSDQIVASGDVTRCKELKLPNGQKDCEYNILANKAIQNKNIGLCDQITDPTGKENCKTNFNSTK